MYPQNLRETRFVLEWCVSNWNDEENLAFNVNVIRYSILMYHNVVCNVYLFNLTKTNQ